MTRRGWGAALAGLLLVSLGLLLERPLLLVGGAVVGAGLVGAAAAFVRHVEATLDGLDLQQAIERERVVAGRRLSATVGATLSAPSALDLAVAAGPPPTASVRPDAPTELSLPADAETARTTYLLAWPHAGRFAFDPPTTTASDALGVFEARVAAGPAPTVTVNPRAPRDIHIGAGGEPMTAAYGEHSGGRPGAGLDPGELRAYQPGDPASRIDWKATARLAEPYVREFERETDRRTLLLLDHRASMALGPEGETKLDYLREVALAIVAGARALDDPLACYTVGDEGLTGRWPPDADRQHYARVERHLAALEPTTAAGSAGPRPTSPAAATRVAAALATDDSGFGRTLAPYFDRPEAYVDRVAGDPVYEAVRTAGKRIRGALWTVLLADDADPTRLEQAVNLARRGEGRVLVLLAPSVLFEPGGLADLEAAYSRYVAFEEHRRSLARFDGVEAYEVAPGDRVGAVLAAGRERGSRRGRVAGGP